MTQPARMVRQRAGVPIYEYRTDPDTPPVALVRSGPEDFIERGRHIHDFPALWYLPAAGLVYVAAAGQVLDPGRLELSDAVVAVFFAPAALGEDARSPWPAWRAHPLLFPFLHGQVGGVLRPEGPAGPPPAGGGAVRSV